MNVELYYFEGCPSYIETEENLKMTLAELGLTEKYKMIEVSNSEDAIAKKFLGSPTIKINGIDLEHKDGNYVFGCRVYTIDGKMQGTPSIEFIKKNLKSFL
ncbi:MAG: hypothetical protein HND50_03270 [Calditrichaeota bacterium]|nr:hypothetical protein [Calditrichota bacterium]